MTGVAARPWGGWEWSVDGAPRLVVIPRGPRQQEGGGDGDPHHCPQLSLAPLTAAAHGPQLGHCRDSCEAPPGPVQLGIAVTSGFPHSCTCFQGLELWAVPVRTARFVQEQWWWQVCPSLLPLPPQISLPAMRAPAAGSNSTGCWAWPEIAVAMGGFPLPVLGLCSAFPQMSPAGLWVEEFTVLHKNGGATTPLHPLDLPSLLLPLISLTWVLRGKIRGNNKKILGFFSGHFSPLKYRKI